jgi:cyclic-di-AMP phosphodiesterase PgpH
MKIFNLNKISKSQLVHLIAFAFSGLIISFLFPNGGKFPYEYIPGQPWKHQNLLAPFDFAVKKPDDLFKLQKDSILKSFLPYYDSDTAFAMSEIENLKQNFGFKWENTRKSKISKGSNAFLHKLRDTTFSQNVQEKYLVQISDIISRIYDKGIIDVMLFDELQRKKTDKLRIIKNNVAESYELTDLFTPRKAYLYLFDEIKRVNKRISADELSFLEDLNLNENLRVNLKYNTNHSEQAKRKLMEDLPETEGMVVQGQNIISQGELITVEKLRVLNSLKDEFEKKMVNKANFLFVSLGNLIIVIVPLFILYLFLMNYRKTVLSSNLKIFFLLGMSVLFIFIGWGTCKWAPESIYIIPFAIVPLIISTFYDSRLALFVHLVTVQLVGFLAPNGFEFVFLQFVAGAVAIFSLTSMQKRGHIFAAAAFITFSYCLVYLGLSIIQLGDIHKINITRFSNFAFNGMLILTSYLWIYLCEKLFGFISDVSLIELMDSNNPLLRLLAEKAPGTFQHSMQVANLAEEAIIQIGGNTHLVRAGAMYHDVGKIEMPHYFIENQMHDINPHEKMNYDKSAEVIIDHVKNGLLLAHKYRLPEQLADFIKTHHGSTKAWYFYRSFKNQNPDLKIDMDIFTYPGPTPFSKETAVVMMADAIEAASRSLKTINPQAISDLVENIINFQISENQFDNANITFKDITVIKKVFQEKLMNIYHARIAYPEDIKNQ